MTGRKNAMLTTEDRRWLTGEKHYEGEHAKQQRYQRRRDIRERVYNSVLDFAILFEHLDDDERAKLFGRPGAEQQPINDDPEFANGICDAIAFFLYNTGITSIMESGEKPPGLPADWLLTEALHRAAHKDGILIENVDLDINATRFSRASLLEDLKAGNELTPLELRLILESEQVDTHTVQEHIRTQLYNND